MHTPAEDDTRQAPLHGVRVLDFSTLLPGPLATLILCRAGAEVIKIERPGGDGMRDYPPFDADGSVYFRLLNQGKRSIALDLKQSGARRHLLRLARNADVLVEQFRPGVMERLGLGYDALHAINPGLVYCSISGYGRQGPYAGRAAHDLNYVAESGLLWLGAAPMIPPVLIADIAGGSYPAVINILLALRQRARERHGAHLDIALSRQLLPLMFWALGRGIVAGEWPAPGGEIFSGGSPRYRLYATRDNAWLALAALEQRFWERFCTLIGLPEPLRDDSTDPRATAEAVAALIGERERTAWETLFEDEDVCCTPLRSLPEALADPALFPAEALEHGLQKLPLPLAPIMASSAAPAPAPVLGEANPGFGIPRI